MKTKTKVVVVGGGVVGVSALYHLAKKGWSDVVLIERKELTSGSTWHAAGLLPLFNMSYSVGQLHKYAVNLYKNLEEEISLNFTHLFSSPTGQAVLQYLRSVTIEAVHGSAVTNDVLRHAEGQRYIVGLIERRMQHGHKTRKG